MQTSNTSAATTPLKKLHSKIGLYAISIERVKHCLEIYLLADCLLLCDVFENFRKNCLQQYNIDPCYY